MKYILPVIALIMLSACSSRPVTSGIGVEQTANAYKEQLNVNNPQLAKKLLISDVKTRQTNNLTDVVVTLASTYKSRNTYSINLTGLIKMALLLKATTHRGKP